MAAHSEESSHEIVLSLADLSIWCYSCKSYITTPVLSKFVRDLGNLKHLESNENLSLDSASARDLENIRQDDLLSELKAAQNARQVGGMYAVTPKDDCPHVILEHINEDFSIFESIQASSSCFDCSNTSENWVCLKCGAVKCSRYVNEHMMIHACETSHAISLSLSDLSFWCYSCESYIVDLDLSEIYRIFSDKKFGKQIPRSNNSTAHVTEEEKQEHFDSEEVLDSKITTLAEWIQQSKYFIGFTGAGISTSAGIPDYRSGFNTVLPTGAGCWERKAAKGLKKEKPKIRVAIEKALPTFTHMSLYKLYEEGLLKCLLSQNVDGLHRKSGIAPEKLAELHGNANVEKCLKCKKEYLRDFGVRNNPHVHMHETGNLCDDPECRGPLIDTIINFGENLDSDVLENCFKASENADLCLAMGSSLRVNPAAMFPKTVSEHGKLVIVNLQKTPLDRYALKINALCDVVMEKLMKKLGLDVPQFYLKRKISYGRRQGKFYLKGVDFNGDHYSFLTKVCFDDTQVKKEPFVVDHRFTSIELHFQGHYGEPPLKIDIPSENFEEREKSMCLTFDPLSGNWI
jgi:NAD-dependent SIR2 family protein deacetylase